MRYVRYKLIVLIASLILSQKCLLAQELIGNKEKFGFKFGLNQTKMNFELGYYQPPTIPLQTSGSQGIMVGFLLNVHLTHKLLLQPEYLYTVRKSNVRSSRTTYKLTYLSLPVLLNYQFNKKFFFLAGPQFDLLLKGEEKSSTGTDNITHDTEERNFCATAGMEFLLTRLISLEARYLHGLGNVGIGQRSNVKEFKYQSAQLSVNLRF